MAKDKSGTSKTHRQLIYALSSDNRYCIFEHHSLTVYHRYAKALSECSSSADCDFVGRMLLSITQEVGPGNTLELIKELIEWEVHKYRHMPSNIFRSNSLSSKALALYVRDVGRNYLKEVLGDVLEELMSERNSLEIDPEQRTREKA
ncbi:hypothetical protein AKO1_008739 [Acrasis kona]|uniref:Ras-GAP domain-containing protein n=1 Tax=Acrasis kona TaxID=1008807 RepID=A0AAW2ZE92_9EUKA